MGKILFSLVVLLLFMFESFENACLGNLSVKSWGELQEQQLQQQCR